MRVFKNVQAATVVSIMIASFMFLIPGAGTGLADGYTRHFKPGYDKRGHVAQTIKHGYHKNTAPHQGRQVTQQTVTTTRYYAPGSSRLHPGKRYNAKAHRNQHAGNKHVVRNSFKHHQKLRHSNFRHQRSAQRHVRHNLGLFAALPGIIVNIPL
jgi:hypothetical protein